MLNIFRVTSLCDPAGKSIPQCRSWFPCGTPREVTRNIFNNDVVLYSQLALILQHGSLTVHLNTKFDMMYPITNMWLIWMVSMRNHHRICICRFFVWLLFVPNSLTSYGDWLVYVLCEWFDVDKCFQSRYMLFECDEFYIAVLELKETYAQASNSNLENDKKLSFCGETSNEKSWPLSYERRYSITVNKWRYTACLFQNYEGLKWRSNVQLNKSHITSLQICN